MNTKTFSYKQEPYIALAELTETLHGYSLVTGEYANVKTWFFNRLNVPKQMRGQGIGRNLLKQVIEWADKEDITIINTVNTYADSPLTDDQTIAFYLRYGFQTTSFTHVLIRYPKPKEEQTNG